MNTGAERPHFLSLKNLEVGSGSPERPLPVGDGVPVLGLAPADLDALSVAVDVAEEYLRALVALVGGPLQPFHSQGGVALDARPGLVQLPHYELGLRVAVLGRLEHPFGGLLLVAGDVLVLQVQLP